MQREVHALMEAETARILEKAAGSPIYVPVLLAITTGMRRGEILGLRWSDVDFDAGAVSVQQTVVMTKVGL